MSRDHYHIALIILAVFGAVLYFMGQPLICECGYVKVWHGITESSENSQHISDWYSFSHVIHGFLFYFFLWLVARRWPVGARLVAALFIETGWEIFENTDCVINRYRESTISLDYFGDSIINSVFDTLFMAFGFILALRLPVWLIVALMLGMELFVGYAIRDNLLLNIIMLIYPIDAVRLWQSGG